LIDTHTHGPYFLAGRFYNGELAIRDLSGQAEEILALRERVESGDLLGPRVFMSGGWMISSEDEDDLQNKWPAYLQDPVAVEREVASLAAMAPQWIKTYSYDSRVIDAAHKQGLPFTSNSPVTASRKSRANPRTCRFTGGRCR